MEATTPLSDVKQFIEINRRKGVHCPCCHQFVKEYRRKLNSNMAAALVYIYRYFESAGAEDWLHIPSYLNDKKANATNEAALLRHWKLIESSPELDEGYYRLTELGIDFVAGAATVPRHVVILDKQVLGFSQEQTSLQEALNDRFDLNELMKS